MSWASDTFSKAKGAVKKYGGTAASYAANPAAPLWGAAYDYSTRNGNGGVGPHAPKDVMIQKAQDRIALSKLLEGTGSDIRTTRSERRLDRWGVTPGGGNAQDALFRLAQGGGVDAKRAKFLEQQLALKNVDTVKDTALKGGQDDIARAYQNLTDQYTANLGPGVDMGSPAVLDAVRRYVEGRSADTTRLTTNLEGQAVQQKNAIMLNQIAPTLDETGALVDSLKMLNQEQAALRRSQYLQLGMSGAGLGLEALMGFGGGGAPAAAPTAVRAAPSAVPSYLGDPLRNYYDSTVGMA